MAARNWSAAVLPSSTRTLPNSCAISTRSAAGCSRNKALAGLLGSTEPTCEGGSPMDRPLEISFHNMDVSEPLKGEIRSLAARLETRFDHLIGCRVVVEKLQNRRRTGSAFDVHVVMKV